MPKKIDHQKRKMEILNASLEVFADEGYKNTSLSLIASRCGLSRTTVYQYFKDTNEILHYALKTWTDNLFIKYSNLVWGTVADPIEKLKTIANNILDEIDSHEKQIINLVKALDSFDQDIPTLIRRRTARLPLLLSRTIREGIKSGLVKECSPKEKVEILMVLIQSYCFQMTYLPDGRKTIRTIICQTFDSLKA